ncbi:hypothetical protein BCR43DRAFT_523461 [Syncephalastrum racemosum]|uniref:Uncharacterized protein n=1 Tax=Syncephalastrum racemosum TaxID=13706 RepID=A0A1X2HE51_SYNRA|nr:hypothetical protein BCR43DRAFT_523461 [Syncephalastrum racemosum]
MDYAFQCDLDGILEYLVHHPAESQKSETVVALFRDKLDQTLAYYKESPGAKTDLHTVLFRAWNDRRTSGTSFAVSRYARGLETAEFYALMDHYSLFSSTVSTIYALPPEEGIEVLQDLIRADLSLSTRFYPAYTRVCRSLREHDIQTAVKFLQENIQTIRDISHYQQSLEPLLDQWRVIHDSDPDSPRLATFQTLVDLFQKAADELLKTNPLANVLWQRMKRVFSTADEPLGWPSPAEGEPPTKRRKIPILRCSDVIPAKPNLKEQWHQISATTPLERHKKAFLLICDKIRANAPPALSLVSKEILYRDRPIPRPIPRPVFDQLQHALSAQAAVSSATEAEYLDTKAWCLYMVYEQIPGCRSVLKVMIQFADLWISDWMQDGQGDTWMKMILQENLLWEYFSMLIKARYRITNDEKRRGGREIEQLGVFFYKLLMHISDTSMLLTIRDHIFNEVTKYDSIEFNLASQEDYFLSLDVENELVRLCNQFIGVEDRGTATTTVLSEILAKTAHQFRVLSALCPFQTVYHIVATCLRKRKQQASTVNLLRDLGRLCRLRSPHLDASSLLVECLKRRFSDHLLDPELADSMVAFVLKTCQPAQVGPGWIPLLMTREFIRENDGVLLDLTDFFDHMLLPSIKDAALDDPRFACSLRIINELTIVPSTSDANLQGTPFLFENERINILCERITSFIKVREHEDAQIDLPSMEVAVALQKKFALILEKYCPLHQAKQILQGIIQHDDGTSMLWTDCIYAVGLRASSAHPKVPQTPDPEIRLSAPVSAAVRTLIGDAYEPHFTFTDGATGTDMNISSAVSILLKGCRDSKIFMDHIFECQAWKDKLGTLSKHPYDQDIMEEALHACLYPTRSWAVHDEYRNLLGPFLCHLYSAFDLWSTVRNYQYEHPEMNTLIQNLCSQRDGERLFLVMNYAKMLSMRTNDMSYQSYFVAGIVKVIQSLFPEKSLTKLSDHNALKKLRAAFKRDDVSEKSLVDVKYIPREPAENEESAPCDNTAEASSVATFGYPYRSMFINTKRAAVILCLCHLLPAMGTLTDKDALSHMRVLILRLAELLADNAARSQFEELITTQTKNVISKWSIYKGEKQRVTLVPRTDETEKHLLRRYVDVMDALDLHTVLGHVLDLYTPYRAPENENREKMKKDRALYIPVQDINPKNRRNE